MNSFSENKWRFMKEEVLYHAKKAEVPKEFMVTLAEFLDYINSSEERILPVWGYYKTLFVSDTLHIPIEKVMDIPVPDTYEKEYPGLLATVVFLAAARKFEKYLEENSLIDSEYNFLQSYYENIHRLMNMNYARDNTYALIRLGEYLYSYAKPLMLRIGRFAYELTRFENDVYDIYEKDGEYKFVPKSDAKFNAIGYPDKNGTIQPINFNKEGWNKVLDDGDYIITMHIPGNERLTKDTIESSLKKSVPILKSVFGEYKPKKLVCTSWLLSPQLKFLRPDSGIMQFQSYYDIVPWYSNDNSFYEHVFCSPIIPPEKLVPKNNFQKSLLDIYLSGGKLHDGFGIIKNKWQL